MNGLLYGITSALWNCRFKTNTALVYHSGRMLMLIRVYISHAGIWNGFSNGWNKWITTLLIGTIFSSLPEHFRDPREGQKLGFFKDFKSTMDEDLRNHLWLRTTDSLPRFRRDLKTHLFTLHFSIVFCMMLCYLFTVQLFLSLISLVFCLDLCIIMIYYLFIVSLL